ncbi:MarR family transcriptional regulator for hemolysin [Bradyrhizobium sp. LB7.2]
MSRGPVDQNFLFTLAELYRLLRVYADKEASRFGITRAQWAVLAKVERSEGMKQSELAELLEVQPITLTRLIDKLCDSDWIERRNDPSDRRVKRLHLKKAGRQLLGRMSGLKSELTANALEGHHSGGRPSPPHPARNNQGKRAYRDPDIGSGTSA